MRCDGECLAETCPRDCGECRYFSHLTSRLTGSSPRLRGTQRYHRDRSTPAGRETATRLGCALSTRNRFVARGGSRARPGKPKQPGRSGIRGRGRGNRRAASRLQRPDGPCTSFCPAGPAHPSAFRTSAEPSLRQVRLKKADADPRVLAEDHFAIACRTDEWAQHKFIGT